MAEQQRDNQEQNRRDDGNRVENGPRDEFAAADNMIGQEQNVQRIPEAKLEEVRNQDNENGGRNPVQTEQRRPNESRQVEHRGYAPNAGDGAIYRDRGM